LGFRPSRQIFVRSKIQNPKSKMKQKGRRLTGALWGGLLRTSPLRCIGTIHIELSTSSPKNFRRTRNQRHVLSGTWPTSPAPRTGSAAPTRPVVEGRSGIWLKRSKNQAVGCRSACTERKQRSPGFIATRRPSRSLCCMVNRIRFLVLIAIQKFARLTEYNRCAHTALPVLHFALFGAD
jgi:hypothetical protein